MSCRPTCACQCQPRAAAALHLEVDDEGRVRVHEAVLAQLLVDAGWERTA